MTTRPPECPCDLTSNYPICLVESLSWLYLNTMPALLEMKSVLFIIFVDGLFCNLEGNSVSKAGLKFKRILKNMTIWHVIFKIIMTEQSVKACGSYAILMKDLHASMISNQDNIVNDFCYIIICFCSWQASKSFHPFNLQLDLQLESDRLPWLPFLFLAWTHDRRLPDLRWVEYTLVIILAWIFLNLTGCVLFTEAVKCHSTSQLRCSFLSRRPLDK